MNWIILRNSFVCFQKFDHRADTRYVPDGQDHVCVWILRHVCALDETFWEEILSWHPSIAELCAVWQVTHVSMHLKPSSCPKFVCLHPLSPINNPALNNVKLTWLRLESICHTYISLAFLSLPVHELRVQYRYTNSRMLTQDRRNTNAVKCSRNTVSH